MRTLRTLLADVRHADVNRLHDVEVVESLAGLVAAGRVWLAAQVTPIGESARFSIESMGPAAAAPPPPTHAASPAPRSAPTEAAEPSFRADVDAPLLAATLKDASKDGVPFCEECARAAMAA